MQSVFDNIDIFQNADASQAGHSHRYCEKFAALMSRMGSGFFLSCRKNREDEAFREFATMTEPLVVRSISRPSYPIADFTVELQRELLLFRSSRPFSIIDKHASLIFVENRTEQSPVEIVQRLRSRNAPCTNILRIIPLEILGHFDVEAIRQYVSSKSVSGSFKILYEARLCNAERKEAVFRTVLPLVNCRVALDNPEFVIVVETFKNLMGVSVLNRSDSSFNFSVAN